MVTPCYTISSTKLACASSFCLIFLSPWSSSTKSVWKIVLKNWTCLSHCFFLWKKKTAHGWDWLFILVYSYNIHPYFKPKAPMKQTKSRSLPLHTLPRHQHWWNIEIGESFFCLENAGAVTFSRSILPMAHSWVEQQLYTYIISIYLYIYIYVKWNIYNYIYIYMHVECHALVVFTYLEKSTQKATCNEQHLKQKQLMNSSDVLKIIL